MELLAIVRRIDTDGDAILLYSEWAEFLRPVVPMPRQPSYTPPRAQFSPPRDRPSSAVRYGSSSPLKSSSPIRASSANRTGGRTSSPVRRSSVSPSRLSPSRKPVLRIYDEDELVHGLKDMCNTEQ
jgi:hypothetical protein